MKSFFLMNLVMGFLLVAVASCSTGFTANAPDYSSTSTSTGGGNAQSGINSNATSDYFPEPCIDWGCSPSSLISSMTNKGYNHIGVTSEGAYKFTYNGRTLICGFRNDKYVKCYTSDLNDSDVTYIIGKYKNSCTLIGERDSYAESCYYYVLMSKDNKTLIVGVRGTAYDQLAYYSMDYDSANCKYFISWVQ